MVLPIKEHGKQAGYAYISSISYLRQRFDARQWNIHQASLVT